MMIVKKNKFETFQVLSGFLVFYNKKHGINTSGLLFLFWFGMFLFGLPHFRTEIMSQNNKAATNQIEGTRTNYFIYFPCVTVMFLLNCMADKPATEARQVKNQVSA